MYSETVLWVALGVAIAVGLALVLHRGALAKELAGERAETAAQRGRTLELERALAAANERVRAFEESVGDESRRTEMLKAQMADLFAQIGDRQIERGTSQLMQLAGERFEKQKAEVQGELESRKAAIDALLGPFAQRLQSLDVKLNEIENKREGAYAKVTEQILALTQATEQLRGHTDILKTETVKLSSSLRNSGARGRWGEFQLRRIVEIAGMNEFCDFSEQSAERDEMGQGRPDMTVRVPGGQRIPVDAKVPLAHYLDACEAVDDAKRAAALSAHARALFGYATELGKRDYTRHDAMTDFVVMFVPNEAALSAALIEEPELFDKAITRGVYVVGPLSLVALLRAYAAGWIIVQQERSAREIAQTGRELYKRFAVFADHLGKVGTALRNANTAFNGAVGSYRDRLVPQARRFEDLGASDVIKTVPDLAEIDTVPVALPHAVINSIARSEAEVDPGERDQALPF
jgi:DNA recombination protein RmuC